MLVEAARIARGKVEALEELRAKDFDALVFSGGFGVAKNLCNFAFVGSDASLKEDVKAVLQDFLNSKKPIGALCIAPILLALIARENGLKGATVTLGDGSAASAVQAVKAWGLEHTPCTVRQAVIDKKHRFVSSPAYMFESATAADVFASACALVKGIKQLLVGT
jgi:enhancing lycopene biosynthesis protein 2